MQLSDRKRLILSVLIKNYIKTGEPVGSKLLIELSGLDVSSATLRNEMSELCELGFLNQPHTSAGRMPTSIGYNFYFKNLMNRREVPADLRIIIDKMLLDASKDPEHLSEVAGQVLSDMTGLPTVMATVTKDEAFIRRAEILSMGSRTVLILLITSEGRAKSRICRSAFDLAPIVLSQFDKIVSNYIIGTTLKGLTPHFLQFLVALSGDLSLYTTPLLNSIFEMSEQLQSRSISVKGETNLMKCYSNEDDARALLSLLTKQETLFSILANSDDDIGIIFGDETNAQELKSSNMVVARYDLCGKDIGRIGVLGPTRMAYEHIIPSVEYFAKKLGEVMTRAINDLDE